MSARLHLAAPFFLLAITLITTNLHGKSLFHHNPNPTTSPNSSTIAAISPHVDNIIDALIGASDFTTWATFLSASSNRSSLPISATLFIPGDDSLSRLAASQTFDPFLFPYHVVPQRLAFADIERLPLNSRIPTLLPRNSIVVTNNSRSNFRFDDSVITHPDLYVANNLCIHGVDSVLDYTVYGNRDFSAPEMNPKPREEEGGRVSSEASCSVALSVAIFGAVAWWWWV